MATKTVRTVVDDLDGSEDDVQTVDLSYRGQQFEIDLSSANRQALDEALAKYLNAGRKTGGRRARGTASKTTAVSADNSTIRRWAAANGIEVPSRGRLSAKIREQFAAANQ